MVARLRTSDASLFEHEASGFFGSVKRLNSQSVLSDVSERYKNDIKPELAVSEQPAALPELENLVFVSAPNALGAGVAYYVTKTDGKEVVTVVSQAKTAGLFDWAVGMRSRFSETYGSFVEGVWTVQPRSLDEVADLTPEEAAPDDTKPDDTKPDDGGDHTEGGKYKPAKEAPNLEDIQRISPPGEFPDIIRFEIKDDAKGKYGDEKFFFVKKSDAAEAYVGLEDAQKVLTAINEFSADGYIIANRTTVAPHLTQVKIDSIKPVDDVPDTLTVELVNGDKYFVNEDLAPSYYSRLQSYQAQGETLSEIDVERLPAGGAIYNNHITKVELNHNEEALPSGMLLVTLKGHPTYGDGTYLVTEADNSQAYDTAMSWYQNGSKVDGDALEINGSYNDINSGGGGRTDAKEFEERFGITREDWDIMSAQTEEHVDPKDDKSRFLTVGELAMKKLRADYEEQAKKDPDSKAAKFIALLDAMAAYSSGRPIQAYTQGSAVSSISGEFYVPSEDWQGVIDYKDLMAESNAMWQDPEIQQSYAKIVGEVIGGLGGPSISERAQKLHDLIVGDPQDDEDQTLALWLAEMKQQNREGEAELVVQNVWSSLALLDAPKEGGKQELVENAMNEFQQQALNVELSLEMEKGIGTDAYSNAYVQDNLNYILNLVKSTPNLMRLAPRVVDFIEGVMSGKFSVATAQSIFSTLEKAGVGTGMKLNDEKINKLFEDKLYRSPGEKKAAMNFLADMNKVGLLGSTVGAISLGSGIYRLLKLDESEHKAQDRMLIARDLLSFLSFSEHFAKGVNWSSGKAVGGINKVFGTLISSPDIVSLMGLNSTMPEIWGRDGRWGKMLAKPETSADIFQAIADKSKTTFGQWVDWSNKEGMLSEINKMTPEQRALHSEWIEHINKGGLNIGLPPNGLSKSWLTKGLGSFIKILGNGLDAPTGIIDIVFNALKIAKGRGDATSVASGVFGLLGGVANTAAGTISGVNALFRTLTFASLSSPLFIVGTILGVVAALIEVLSGQRDTDAKLDKQREWLASLDDAGVLKEDWGKAFEFINTWYAEAKGRNDLYNPEDAIPLGLSIFDFDRERWDRFQQNWEPGELPREVDNFFNYEEERSWWANVDEDLVFEWNFGDDNYNPGNKISPDHPAAKEYREKLDDFAAWYSDNIDLTQKPVQLATFDNDTPKKAIEEMADFYLTYIDPSADTGDIAIWVKDELVKALPAKYDDADEGDRAAGAIGAHFDKHGGKDVMVAIIDGTLGHTESPRTGFENTLNEIVSIYAETAEPGKSDDDEDKIDNDPISTDRRQLIALNQEPIKDLFVDLLEYYFKNVKIESGKEKTAEMAADWAIGELKDRIGIAFEDALNSDDEAIREEAEDKIEIFNNYLSKKDKSGRSDAIEIAKELLGKS